MNNEVVFVITQSCRCELRWNQRRRTIEPMCISDREYTDNPHSSMVPESALSKQTPWKFNLNGRSHD